MTSTIQTTASTSKASRWAGYTLSVLAILFLLFDGTIKVLQLPVAVESTTQLGYAANLLLSIGLVELACLLLYALPQTAILGAILMTGYLGGAVATHVRAGSDWFSLIFPFMIGALLWGGLYLRNETVRKLIPLLRN
ncbi:MAG: DoxX family protein [Caldilineaceae bacterium]